MVNSFVSKQDLDSEMTVVRNEFEMGENNPGGVLVQRMQQLAFPWHNYGNPIIGSRSDIENVPIDKLQAFYRTWYQPDNAVLIIAGRFDQAKAVSLVQKHFGALPRPTRALPAHYTAEPTQDGERRVRLERVGDNPVVSTLYRVPAGSHPDYPAIDLLVNVLGDIPAGRLHRALVQEGLASHAWGGERALHDPGYVLFGAYLGRGAKRGRCARAAARGGRGWRARRWPRSSSARARRSSTSSRKCSSTPRPSLMRSLTEFWATGISSCTAIACAR